MLNMDKQPRQRGLAGRWRALSKLVNGDREDSKGQYLALVLVIAFCIVLGVVIDVLAG
jgi:hypothetical protein